MAQARKHHHRLPKARQAKTAQDAARFVDLAAPGQEGVDLPGKVGSARPAPQPLARHGPPWGAASRDPRLARRAGAPPPPTPELSGQPESPPPAPQRRAPGHPAPARTAFASTSLSAATRLRPAPQPPGLAPLFPGETHPTTSATSPPLPQAGPPQPYPDPTSTSLEIATPSPADWVTDRQQHVHDTFTIAVKRWLRPSLLRVSVLLGSAPRGSALTPAACGLGLHPEAGAGGSWTGQEDPEVGGGEWLA